jgi:hypothetical protein
MSQGKRLLVYVILNIIVSAVTTLTVLWLWDQAHPTPTLPGGLVYPTGQPTGQTQTATPGAQTIDTLDAPIPVNQVVIAIDNVYGVGSLADEIVVIKSKTDSSLKLTNWQLEDGSGNVFTFPELILNKGGAVQVHSAAGVNTVIDLYWGRDTAVWQEGKTAVLLDAQGIERARYTIP